MTRNYQLVNYQEKLSASILCRGKCGNYKLITYREKLSASVLCRGKCGNYRDTGVSKNHPSLVYYRGQILRPRTQF